MYGIFAYIWVFCMVNVGKYTSPMDPMCIEDDTKLDTMFVLSQSFKPSFATSAGVQQRTSGRAHFTCLRPETFDVSKSGPEMEGMSFLALSLEVIRWDIWER